MELIIFFFEKMIIIMIIWLDQYNYNIISLVRNSIKNNLREMMNDDDDEWMKGMVIIK